MISFNLDFSSEKCALVCSNFGISSRHRNIFNLNDLDPNNLGFD
ncbi:ABC transporter, partial [Mannheimia haemolytica]